MIDLQPDLLSQPAADVAGLRALLREHRDIVREDSELLAELGLRVDIANIIDFGPVALSRISAAHERESSERQRLETMARDNFVAQAQTHAGVVDLLEAGSLEDLAQRLDEMACLRFGLACGALAVEGPGATPTGWLPLAEGQGDLIMGAGRATRLGRMPTACGLFGARARHVGSVALTRLSLWSAQRQGVLAFGSPDPDAFNADMGAELITFLARVVERTALRWDPD